MVNNIHENNDFQRIKEICLLDDNHSLLIIKVLKILAHPTNTKAAFMNVCYTTKGIHFDLRGISIDDNKAQKIFDYLYNISNQVHQWQNFLADLVEYLVFIALRGEGFRVQFEPDVRYKRKNIIRQNRLFSNKKFDIGSHMNKQFFVLGECKTNLSSFIERRHGQTRLTNGVFQQINKITHIYLKILNSKTKNGDKVYCNRYLFVLNKINVSLHNAPNIKVLELEEIFENDFFLSDLGVI